jgi:hypothetical protein
MTIEKTTVQRFFDDLLTLEVNLILKADMTARKMPLTGEAFHDIADHYSSYIGQQTPRLGELTPQVFLDLNKDARDMREANKAQADPQEEYAAVDIVLKRIERNSSQLARIMNEIGLTNTSDENGNWIQLTVAKKEDLLVLRKAWEVGTESVIMQTVAQVDGDIVTRLQPALAAPDHGPIHSVHMKLVTTGLEQWRFLFATVATITIGVLQTFF